MKKTLLKKTLQKTLKNKQNKEPSEIFFKKKKNKPLKENKKPLKKKNTPSKKKNLLQKKKRNPLNKKNVLVFCKKQQKPNHLKKRRKPQPFKKLKTCLL